MKLSQRSLARRLFLHFLFIGGGVFALIGLMLYLFSINFANLAVEQSMFGMTEDIQENLYFDAQGSLQYRSDSVAEKWGYDALYNNLGFRVMDQQSGQILLTSIREPEQQHLIAGLPQQIPLGYSRLADDTDCYRILFELHGRQLMVDLARNDLLGELANEAVMPVLEKVSILTMGAAFLVFIFVTYLSVRTLVKPVNDVAAQLQQIKPNQLDVRLPVDQLPSEILPLVQSLNSAMDRVEKGFNEQKRFVANAAHELRTPLAVLTTRVELAELPDDVSTPILGDARYMSRVVEQLLDLSRAQNQSAYRHKAVDLNKVGKDVCMLLGPLSVTYDKELEMESGEGDCRVQGDQGALIILTKNLLENALKHASPGALVKLVIGADSLSVIDSGPGIDEADRVKLFERFWRKDQTSLSGSGLGLSIVSEIAHAHNASITVIGKNNLGGASFIVRFDSHFSAADALT
ncbi:ATP-binding protein [Bowmanella denitrificans]|uniref:ATP-binding protein n=1 Tax=Bowmanella denitrificans TaxID=366582 RepID=UPI000C9CA1B2|nr:ATP-binding protein [Bowmanella denitrificans]